MKLFGKDYTRDALLKRIGDLSQVAGIKAYTLTEGRAQGVEALDVKTGSGLNFTVLPGRALDIAWMEFQGKPLGFIGKGGVTHAAYYQPKGLEWLRSFYGGLLTTCGLTQVGPPQQDGDWDLGLHGRLSNTPAAQTAHRTDWHGDELHLTIEGQMREAVLFGENLLLRRKITVLGGESKLILEDTVENQGYQNSPFMILYHINLGYPVIGEDSVLEAPVIQTQPRDAEAQAGLDAWHQFQGPTPDCREQVFFHKLKTDDEGYTCAGVLNDVLNIGFYVRYRPQELPCFTQWKMMGQQDYVVGLEPGNCPPLGRATARERGELVYLKPGEIKTIKLELGVLTCWEDLQAYKDYVQRIKKGKG